MNLPQSPAIPRARFSSKKPRPCPSSSLRFSAAAAFAAALCLAGLPRRRGGPAQRALRLSRRWSRRSRAAPDPWSGLYVGTGISAWGGKGVKGGVGGEGYLGYDHVFDNGVVVGVRASSGYEPFLWSTPRIHSVRRNRFRRRRGDHRLPDGAADALCHRRRRSRPADPLRLWRFQPARRDQHRLLRTRAPSRRSARSGSASITASPTISAWASRRSCTTPSRRTRPLAVLA